MARGPGLVTIAVDPHKRLKVVEVVDGASTVLARQQLGGPGGHVGATRNTSATGSTPNAGSSVKPQPGPRRNATPAVAHAS